jgi:hypothetical protein
MTTLKKWLRASEGMANPRRQPLKITEFLRGLPIPSNHTRTHEHMTVFSWFGSNDLPCVAAPSFWRRLLIEGKANPFEGRVMSLQNFLKTNGWMVGVFGIFVNCPFNILLNYS